MSPKRKHIVVDKATKSVVFQCQTKEEMELVLTRYIEGCKIEARKAREQVEAEELRDAFKGDRGN